MSEASDLNKVRRALQRLLDACVSGTSDAQFKAQKNATKVLLETKGKDD
jgi:hypothetical protein